MSDHAALLADVCQALGGEINFPTCFDAALRIRRVLALPDVGIDDIEHAVASEPLLCTRLLRLANTAFYNPGGSPISRLRVAIVRLGNESVRTLAFAVAIDQMTRLAGMARLTPIAREYWEFSLELASTAQALARRNHRSLSDDALLAGLTSQLGAFFVLYRAAEDAGYSQSPDQARAIAQVGNPAIAERLLNALEVPSPIIAAILALNSPEPAHTALGGLLQTAHAIAQRPEHWPIDEAHRSAREINTSLLAEIEADITAVRNALLTG